LSVHRQSRRGIKRAWFIVGLAGWGHDNAIARRRGKGGFRKRKENAMKTILNRTMVAALASLLVMALAHVAAAFPSRGGSCTSCHSEPGGSLTASPNPLDIELGQSGLLTFSITNLGGSSDTAISVQGLENPALKASIAPGGDPWTHRTNATYGMSYVSNSISSTGPYTLNLAIGSPATPGAYPIIVMYAGDGERGTESSFTLRITPVLAAADFDEDGDVDGADLARWETGFGTTGTATHMQGDADHDLDADGADFVIWQRQLGGAGSLVSASVVPEPATAMLLLAGCAAAGTLARCRTLFRTPSRRRNLRP
jgi:hypothetical protein